MGVCDSSSLMGLSADEYRALPDEVRSTRLAQTADLFLQAGAHAVICSLSELPVLVDELNLANLPYPQRLSN